MTRRGFAWTVPDYTRKQGFNRSHLVLLPDEPESRRIACGVRITHAPEPFVNHPAPGACCYNCSRTARRHGIGVGDQ